MTKCVLHVFEFSWLVLPKWRQCFFSRNIGTRDTTHVYFFFVKESGKVPIIYNIFCNVSVQYFKKVMIFIE